MLGFRALNESSSSESGSGSESDLGSEVGSPWAKRRREASASESDSESEAEPDWASEEVRLHALYAEALRAYASQGQKDSSCLELFGDIVSSEAVRKHRPKEHAVISKIAFNSYKYRVRRRDLDQKKPRILIILSIYATN